MSAQVHRLRAENLFTRTDLTLGAFRRIVAQVMEQETSRALREASDRANERMAVGDVDPDIIARAIAEDAAAEGVAS